MTEPITLTPPDPPRDFVGRREVLDALHQWLDDDQTRAVLLMGEPGSGKSGLAAMFVQEIGADSVAWTTAPSLRSDSIDDLVQVLDDRDTNLCVVDDVEAGDPLLVSHFVRVASAICKLLLVSRRPLPAGATDVVLRLAPMSRDEILQLIRQDEPVESPDLIADLSRGSPVLARILIRLIKDTSDSAQALKELLAFVEDRPAGYEGLGLAVIEAARQAGANPLIRRLRNDLAHTSTLDTRRVALLCRSYLEDGEPEAAEALLKFGHASTVGGEISLSSSLIAQGQFSEAERVLRRCIEDTEPDSPEFLAAISNLAAAVGGRGQLVDAESLLLHVVDVRASMFGEGHPQTLTAMANLAATKQRLGRYDEALALLDRVVHARVDLHGTDHPETLAAEASRAAVLQSVGRNEESLSILRRLFEQQLVRVGDEHPETLSVGANLATALQRTGRTEQASDLLRWVVEQCRSVLGPDHPSTLTSEGNLAVTLEAMGRIDEAAEVLYRVVDARRSNPDDERGLASAYHQLGNLCTKQLRFDEAERWYRTALELFSATADRIGAGATAHQLGTLFANAGLSEDALRMYKRALELREELGDRVGVAETLHRSGIAALALGSMEEASSYLNRALLLYEEINDRTALAYIYDSLRLLAETTDDRDAVEMWSRRTQLLRGEATPRLDESASDVSGRYITDAE